MTIPPSLWSHPDALAALRARDIGRLFRLIRQYAGASQTQIAIACLNTDEEGSPVQRRTFHRLTTAGLFRAVLSDLPDSRTPLAGVEAFAAALAGHPDVSEGLPDSVRPDLSALRASVAASKRDYQACRYSTAIKALPGLLADLASACDLLKGDDRLQAHTLSAEAYHVAASILLKLDDEGLAWPAADRSMRAARISEDPVTIGSSARIVTHALMDDGHYDAASATAAACAVRLERDIDEHTPDSLSIYGSLLLRGATSAGRRNDRATVATMLDEAEDAADRLGGDHNYRRTAFGPTNVRLHRVNISASLGDAGHAIAEARRIEFDRIPITERKAALLIDTSRALTQWGKHEKAYEILRAAHQLAPQEVSTRPAVHRLVRDLLAAAPRSLKRQIREFGTQIAVRF
ncbi:XRE family transcriptional regulator [Actinoallomurus soli]|uniref:XRE family transcriptional regulator n=1 Tax=Actinoallomurus soli TaxID=2952535 RepID=UPI0020939B33|nr:XRE family transcriptional regulator [Actinoallomurus soli]MCO5967742.1 XRE family transcriptional regulator [Actinoallomurus soli]